MLKQTKQRKGECMLKRKGGFTLAETLLTLALLGVLSLLVLGGVKYTDSQQYPIARAMFKNELATAMATMNIDKPLNSFTNTEGFVTEFAKFYGMADSCSSTKECFASSYKDAAGNQVKIKEYDQVFKTNNGAAVALSYVENEKPLSSYTAQTAAIDQQSGNFEISNAAMNYVTGVFDVNGAKGPNKIGQDMGILMPAVALNKAADGTIDPSLQQYLTLDDNGAVYIKSLSGSGNSDDGIKVVDEDGTFSAPESTLATSSTCPNANYIVDDFGACNICGLTSATCAAQGTNLKLNKDTCNCEANRSCPKNKIQDENGNCVCANNSLQCNTQYTVNGSATPDQDSCTCTCKMGAALKCQKNGGVWDATTCSCLCSGAGATAEDTCQTKTHNTGYAAANPDNFCACECKSDIQALQTEMNQRAKDAGAAGGTIANNNVEQGCYACASSSGNDTYIKDDSIGVCRKGCSAARRAEFATWGTSAKPNALKYLTPPKMDADGRLADPDAGCKTTCVLTDAYCQTLAAEFRADNNLNVSSSTQCPKLEDRVKPCQIYKGKFSDPTYSRNSYYGHTFSGDDLFYNIRKFKLGNQDESANCNSAGITLKANKDTCQCEPVLPAGFVTASRTKDSWKVYYHGSGGGNSDCWLAEVNTSTWTRTGNNTVFNSGNPDAPQAVYGPMLVKETFSSSYDPIVLTPYTDYNSISTLPMNEKGVTVKFAEADTTLTPMTWISGNKGNKFLKKAGSFTSIEGSLFSDVVAASGYQELRSGFTKKDGTSIPGYDSNGDFVINEIDDAYNKLYVWDDKDSNASVGVGEQTSIADDMIIEISTLPGVGGQTLGGTDADIENTPAGQVGAWGNYKKLEKVTGTPKSPYFLRVPYSYNPFDAQYTDGEKLLSANSYVSADSKDKRIVYIFEKGNTTYLIEQTETGGYVAKVKITKNEIKPTKEEVNTDELTASEAETEVAPSDETASTTESENDSEIAAGNNAMTPSENEDSEKATVPEKKQELYTVTRSESFNSEIRGISSIENMNTFDNIYMKDDAGVYYDIKTLIWVDVLFKSVATKVAPTDAIPTPGEMSAQW